MQIRRSDSWSDLAVDFGALGAQSASGIFNEVLYAAVDRSHCIVGPHSDPKVCNVGLLFETGQLGTGHTSERSSRVRQNLKQNLEVAARPAEWAEYPKIG
jgi:hypothetical protein